MSKDLLPGTHVNDKSLDYIDWMILSMRAKEGVEYMEEDYLKQLWYECVARDSFCVKLRVDLEWDKEAFDRLMEAMRRCCKHYELASAEQLKQQYEQAREFDRKRRAGEEPALQSHAFEDKDDLRNPPLPETKRLFPDWLAETFWYTPEYIIDWTSHESWKKTIAGEPEYFKKAYERLRMLASWFFTGYCPWMDEEEGWASTFVNR